MGSYAKYQERLAKARENMQRRKNINLGREVMLVPLKQEILYTFQDAPTTEEKLDNLLSLLVRKERAMAAAEIDLRKHQDSVSVLTFFRALGRVRELEKGARDNMIEELRLVGEQLEEARRVAGDKKTQATFFMNRLHNAEQRLDELKYRSASTAAESEAICDWSLDLCAMGAVEEGFCRRSLDATADALFKERDKHEATRKELEAAREEVRIFKGKVEHLSEYFVKETSRLEEEVEILIGSIGQGKSLATAYGIELALYRERYEHLRLVVDRAWMLENDTASAEWFGEVKVKKGKKKGKKGKKKGKKGKKKGKKEKKGAGAAAKKKGDKKKKGGKKKKK